MGLFVLLCLAATISASLSADVECDNTPPNIARIALGVDLSTLDLLPIDFTSQNGFKNRVLKLTCNENKKWRHHGQTYQKPDQVSRISNIPGGWLTADVKTYKTSRDVRKKMNLQVGVSGKYNGFSFSASTSYEKIQNTIKNEERYISDTSSYHSSNKVELFPSFYLSLDSVAQMFLDRIGEKSYMDDPDAYQEFINEYGTHYFASGQFGGQIRVIFSTSQSYAKSHSSQTIQANAKASFLKSFSASVSFGLGKTKVDEDFKKETSNTIRYYGGSTNLLSAGGLSAWQPTVDSNPWLFTGRLKPIADVIKDDFQKKNMELAVMQHLMRNHFKELRRTLESARNKLGYTVAIEDLVDRIDKMDNIPLGKLVEKDVKALSKEIENAMTVPSWFKDRTQICMKWYPDGDRGECGGPKSTLCAAPGKMTPFYRDDTDSRAGGCNLKWSLQSRGYDAWFRQVRLCYRWFADGPNDAQCSGKRRNQVCAPINSYTPFYRDDTDRRPGGCQMSWKLQVPNNAPMWLKYTKLCFSWYPDGDRGQCGGRSRFMCAKANEWTSNYRDDTDRRYGGCQMSWGLQFGF